MTMSENRKSENRESEKEVLVIGTYGIDVFYGIVDELENHHCRTYTTDAEKIVKEYLQNRAFDAIIINLEPDGKGGVAEIDLLNAIAQYPLQRNAICLGLSAHYPHSLPSTKSDKHLKILAGWLTLPIQAKVLANHILNLLESDHKLKVGELLDNQ